MPRVDVKRGEGGKGGVQICNVESTLSVAQWVWMAPLIPLFVFSVCSNSDKIFFEYIFRSNHLLAIASKDVTVMSIKPPKYEENCIHSDIITKDHLQISLVILSEFKQINLPPNLRKRFITFTIWSRSGCSIVITWVLSLLFRNKSPLFVFLN